MKNNTNIITAMLIALAMASSYAFAQDSNASGAPKQGEASAAQKTARSAASEVQPGEVQGNQARVHWTEEESLFLIKLRNEHMEGSGFTPSLTWTGEQWSNISGGLSSGTTWNSLFTIGLEQDFSELAGTKGLGSIGVSAFYYTATESFSDKKLGAMSDASNIFSGEMVRMFEIFYKNELETEYGTFGMRIGQLAADEDFMGIDAADIFLNSNFGAMPTVAGNATYSGAGAFSQYSLATLGATIYWANEDFDAIVGIYNGNCGEDAPGNHGFDYELESIAVWYQLGYNYKVGDLGGRFQIGGNYHSGQFVNYDTGDTSRNFYSFYLGLQQDFIADKEGNSVLCGFVRAAWAPDDAVADYTKYVDLGIAWFEPIPGRSDDVVALGYSAMETGRAFRNANAVNRYDTMLELTYRAQIIKSISIQPSFQMYFNTPDQTGATNMAYVLGARLEVAF